jgi:hypothetical protein
VELSVNEPIIYSFLLLIFAAWAYYQDVYVRNLHVRQSRVPFLVVASVITYALLAVLHPYLDSILAQFDTDAVKILVIVAVVGIVIKIYQDARSHREDLQQVARRLGLSYDPAAKNPLPVGLLQVPILLPLQEVTQVLRSESQGNECAIFRYEMSLGEDSVSQTVAGYRLPCLIPAFLLKPETYYDKLSAALGGSDLDFSSHPQFSSRYRLV